MSPQGITQNRAKDMGMILRYMNYWLGVVDSFRTLTGNPLNGGTQAAE